MNRIISFFVIAALCASLSGCGGKATSGEPSVFPGVQSSYDVKGVTLSLSEVPAGTFSMGSRKDRRIIDGASTRHQVLMDGYVISSSPVSQALWEAVMGKNPSSAVNPDLPVDRVTYDDCLAFTSKLSKITGVPFTLPTEAMWEYANSLGILDWQAGLPEWCLDAFDEKTPDTLSVNYFHKGEGPMMVVREAIQRSGGNRVAKAGGLTFRVAVYNGKTCPEAVSSAMYGTTSDREHVCAKETITVGECKIEMIPVKGGSFMMGGTAKQQQYADPDELPVTFTEVESFEMATIEVTAGLWNEVMGYLPLGNYAKEPDKPVVNISWYNAQEFILELNRRTGRKFRLPTEAEWEYAARGGASAREEFRYAGADVIKHVAVYAENSNGDEPSVGKTKASNELGIYDLCGNVWEWCQNLYYMYGNSPVEGANYVQRGGSFKSAWSACRVSNRQDVPPGSTKSTFGLRVVI
ncbi:MAG: SUMF1/EgtB/PvdO family nonheme iron enzyme [Bacteroidales bacterium]|nr:SUMF1/EgtB/PvdO family nonheme iron enzyme [Bacteroidales bacterium]